MKHEATSEHGPCGRSLLKLDVEAGGCAHGGTDTVHSISLEKAALLPALRATAIHSDRLPCKRSWSEGSQSWVIQKPALLVWKVCFALGFPFRLHTRTKECTEPGLRLTGTQEPVYGRDLGLGGSEGGRWTGTGKFAQIILMIKRSEVVKSWVKAEILDTRGWTLAEARQVLQKNPETAALCPAPRFHPVFKTAHKTMDVGRGSGHPRWQRAPKKQASLLHLPLQLGQSLRTAGPRPFSVALTGAVGGRKSRTAAAWETRPRRDWQREARTPAPSGLRALRLRSQKQLIPRDPSLSLPSSAQRYCHFYAYCIPLA